MKNTNLFSLVVFIVISLGSCNVKNEQGAIKSSEGDLFQRQKDQILNRTDLQEVVKYQNLRDAVTLSSYFTNEDPDIRARAAFAMASVQDSSFFRILLYCSMIQMHM